MLLLHQSSNVDLANSRRSIIESLEDVVLRGSSDLGMVLEGASPFAELPFSELNCQTRSDIAYKYLAL
jgi:hypothetical protein